MKPYGGPWQECRALVATWLISVASWVHFRATMDVARMLRSVPAPSVCPHCDRPLREGTDGPYRVCGGCGFTESDPGFS